MIVFIIILFLLFYITNTILFYEKFKNKKILLYSEKSKYQKIQLYQDNDEYYLNLNNQMQFHSKQYKISNYIQAIIPIQKYKPKNVLILGGGDGLLASFILKYTNVEKITIVEIDENMIKMTKENSYMRKITNDVFYNSKINIIIDDALEYMVNKVKKYEFDMILEDVEIDFINNFNSIIYEDYLIKCIDSTKYFVLSLEDDDKNNKKINYDDLEIYEKENKKKNYKKLKYKLLQNPHHLINQILNIEKKENNTLIKYIKNYNIKTYISAYDYIDDFGLEGYLLFVNI